LMDVVHLLFGSTIQRGCIISLFTSTTSDPFIMETEANDTLVVDCFTKFEGLTFLVISLHYIIMKYLLLLVIFKKKLQILIWFVG
jgi:hypothetical protein